MRNKNKIPLLLAALFGAVILAGCGSSSALQDSTAEQPASQTDEFEDLWELTWEGTELTIFLPENRDTGCEWETKPQNDRILDYSINRSFKLSNDKALKGQTAGALSAGFKGTGEGTTQVICWTPVDWDGTGEGYTYIVTVTVNADGTIESATGKEGSVSDRADYNAARYAEEETE